MKTIVLIGMKGCGKSTVGKSLAEKLNYPFVELDHKIEQLHKDCKKEDLSCRQIINKYMLDYFRNLENLTLKKISLIQIGRFFILACGGGTPLQIQNRKILKSLGTVIYLRTDKELILDRIKKDGIPSFFPKDKSLEEGLDIILKKRSLIYENIADITVNIITNDINNIIKDILEKIKVYEN